VIEAEGLAKSFEINPIIRGFDLTVQRGDRIATTTGAMDGNGKATIYADGWSSYQAQRPDTTGTPAPEKQNKPKSKPQQQPKSGLSFTKKHRPERSQPKSSASKPRSASSKSSWLIPISSPVNPSSSRKRPKPLWNFKKSLMPRKRNG